MQTIYSVSVVNASWASDLNFSSFASLGASNHSMRENMSTTN